MQLLNQLLFFTCIKGEYKLVDWCYRETVLTPEKVEHICGMAILRDLVLQHTKSQILEQFYKDYRSAMNEFL